MSNTINLLSGPIRATNFETIGLFTGSGDDKLIGGGLNDTLSSGGGDDRITGLDGIDSLNGGDGSDSLYGGEGSDYLVTTFFDSPDSADVLDGGNGGDRITTRHGSTVIGGNGIDFLYLNLGDQNGNFTLDITKAKSVLDATTSVSGIEWLAYTGGSGNDSVKGDALADDLNGAAGNDVLRGGDDNDTLQDGEGNDSVFGDNGDDRMTRTGGGIDLFDGGNGDDTFIFASFVLSAQLDLQDASKNAGQAQGLTLQRIEKIVGSFADDDLRGGRGNDNFDGNFGDDVLMGRDGNDTLNGGGGDDWLTGGTGSDQFLFDYSARGGIADIITDFNRGEDKLAFLGFGMTAGTFNLKVGTDPVATMLQAAFLFESDNGRLWFDADGSGGFTEAELIAILQGVTTLAQSDFTFL
jgi:Ca2+-binding RTX toxin-like protein